MKRYTVLLIGVLLALIMALAGGAGAQEAVTQGPDLEGMAGREETEVVTGNTRWITIACKFADVSDEPRDIAFFQNMYASSYPGLDHYWREASYGQINLIGSTAVGWFTLPKGVEAYRLPDGSPDFANLQRDCWAAGDATVYFPDYFGIMIALNAPLGGSGCGGGSGDFDGQPRDYYATCVLFPNGFSDITIVEHEMGHGYGLPHSYALNNAYGSRWDVMSNPNYNCTAATDPVYGCVGQGPIADGRDKLGWIPAGRRFIANAGDDAPAMHTVTLARTGQPPADNTYLIAIVPIDGSATHYYTVEARLPVGYDTKLPAAVIIHEIGGLPFSPRLMGDYGEGVNFAGDMWLPGETFVGQEGGVKVSVDSATSDGFKVTITNGLPTASIVLSPVGDTYVSLAAPNANFGSSPTLDVSGFYSEDPTRMRAALRFDPVQLPPNSIRYRLRLKIVADGGGTWPGYASLLRTTYINSSIPWTENGLTWNNIGGWVSYDRSAVRHDEWLEWDLTQDIIGLGFQSFSIRGTNSIMQFSSKEGPNPPQLIIDYLVPPNEPTTTTFTPTNDAYVSQAKPKAIYGTKPALQVKDAAKDVNSYVKFNVAGLSGTVQSATLRLWATDGGPDGGKVYTVSPFYLNTTTQWLETGLKWSNAPLIGGTALDNAGAVAAGGWVELDVTAAVVASLAGNNGRVSLALTNDSRNLIVYSSKEGAHPPQLVVITN